MTKDKMQLDKTLPRTAPKVTMRLTQQVTTEVNRQPIRLNFVLQTQSLH